MRLAHLSLGVTDQQRSRRFYESYFGFNCTGEPDSEGCLHLTVDLRLAPRSDVSPSGALHFGLMCADPESVRRLLTRLSDDEDVQTSGLFESDSRIAFHCWDPDGYQLEIFWRA